MKFGEKLRKLRIKNHLTQSALAKELNVSLRTLQNYEAGKVYPKQSEIYGHISKLFEVSTDYLLTDTEEYLVTAQKNESHSDREIEELIAQVGSLFAGGAITEDDKDKVLCTINDLYWKAKENNKRKKKETM